MCGAYEGCLPQEVLLALGEGDPILVGHFGCWVSWLIMYLTNSHISHVALYVGDGKILHATLRGVEIAPIGALFSPKARLLPCKAPIPTELRDPRAWKNTDKLFLDRRYSVMLVICKGLLIIFGRYPRCFRWRLSADVCITIAVTILAIGASRYWYLLMLGYIAIVLINKARRPPREDSRLARFYGVPSDLLVWILRFGVFMPDPISPWSQRAVNATNSPWNATIFRRRHRSETKNTELR